MAVFLFPIKLIGLEDIGMSEHDEPRITRFKESGRRKLVGGAIAAVGALVGFWFGVKPIWERNDDAKTVQALSLLATGASVVVLAANEALLQADRDDRGKVRAIFTTVGVLSLATCLASFGGGDDGSAARETDPTAAVQASTESTVPLSTPSETVIVTSAAPETGEVLSFAYNGGNPLPAGRCAIDAPITGDTSAEDVMVLQTRLNDGGFDAGVVDGKSGRQTAAAVNRLQVAFGMPEALANDASTRWSQNDCYEASVKIPSFAGMWVTE